MIRIANEQELRECFRSLDRDELSFSEDLRFPLVVKDYLAWSEPSGFRVFLVLADRQKRQGFGIVFRRDQSAASVPHMCEWCHAVRGGNGVSLLTAASSEKKRVGLHLCRDLSCKAKAEASPGPDDTPLALTGYQRIRRITDRMAAFARQNCF